MKISGHAVTVFPTELAKRQFERRVVLKQGVLDTSRLLTMRQLLDRCEHAARQQKLLSGRRPGEAEFSLRLEQAAGRAATHPPARLSIPARSALLQQLIESFAFLAGERTALQQWLCAHSPDHKLHGFGQLLREWETECEQVGIADRFAVNTALLALTEGGKLPPELNDGIDFRAVRWFNPFEERFVAALKTRLGGDAIRIFSVLPFAHADAAGDRLHARVRSEIGSEEEWTRWAEDFADACEADDSNLLESESRERVSFFVSAHPYGEIEDAARRIADKIERGTAPEQLALILRNLSPCTDIVPDVFRRFGIPYYFRRGTPAAAHPTVKALLALLAFSQTPTRDRLCDLLRHPGIDWPGVEDREALAQQLLKTEPPRLTRLPKELSGFSLFVTAQERHSLDFNEQLRQLIKQHGLALPEDVLDLLDELGGLPPLSPQRMTSLFETRLDSTLLANEQSTERGVRVLNPMDTAGLRFDTVFIAGMDDRSFPQIPKADALLTRRERLALRTFLAERGIPCPRLALSETGQALIQEEILFLTTLGAANEKLVLSYTRSDTDGKERAPGEFFERMCKLVNGTPEHGESFHTILPPESVRAEDEARQTRAWLEATPPSPIQQSSIPVPALHQWLDNNPEFSATALESLARNRFVFFLEKMLRIKPDRTHEDDTDPIDRGNVIHDILEQVYTAIAEQSGLYAQKTPEGWIKAPTGDIPLAIFDPSKTDEYLSLARNMAEKEFKKAERRPSRHLGHPAVWGTEKARIQKVIENFIRMDCETAPDDRRFPALFEMKFDEAHDLPVTLHAPSCKENAAERSSTLPALQNEDAVRLKGKIDRIDLVFSATDTLERVLVIDYKSRSRTDTVETLEAKIGLNLDCQLALYTFAAQQVFFGEHNRPELNQTVQALYHLQERDLKKMTSHFHRNRVSMTPERTEAFLDTLFTNIRKLRAGDLATEPLIAGFEEYSHICRTEAVSPETLTKERRLQIKPK